MRDVSSHLPETVRVTFVPRACGTATQDSIPDEWHEEATLDGAGLGAGLGVPFTLSHLDTCGAIYSTPTATVPKNQGHLVALAEAIGRDLWQWRTVAYDRAYAGIIAPEMEGLSDEVEWSYREDDCSTRLTTVGPDDAPSLFNHADTTEDCPDCIGVYGPTLSKSGGNVILKKYKLCLEDGELVRKDDGSTSLAACCTSGTCSTYAVQVLNTKGNPVPGISVVLNRVLGTRSSFGTPSPVSGTTDSAGIFSYPIPADPPQYITGALAKFPLSEFGVGNNSPTVVGSTCTYRYMLCKKVSEITTVDGDGGGPISGATIFGSPDCIECTPGPTPPHPYYVVDGAKHTRTSYILYAIEADGRVGAVSSAGDSGSSAFSCKEGYWGDCATATPDCDEVASATVNLWNKDKYLYNPTGQCYGDRNTVIEKKMCVRLVDAPIEVVGDDQYELQWDSTTWDGCPSAFNKTMVFRGCFPAGGAIGSCLLGTLEEATDVPYGSVEVVATFIGRINGGAPFLSFQVTPHWAGGCNGGAPPRCDEGDDVPPWQRIYAGPHLDCRGPFYAGIDDLIGFAYYFVMPRTLSTFSGGFGNYWHHWGTDELVIGALGGVGDGTGLYDQWCYLWAGNTIEPFMWGCNPYESHSPRVRLTDGPCTGGGGPGAAPARVAMAAPAPAPATGEARPAVRDLFGQIQEAKACPHLTPPACGCPGSEGSCGLGKGRRGLVVMNDCVRCVREERLVFKAHVNSFTGYGQLVGQMARQVEAAGIPVAFDPIDVDEVFLPLDPWVRARLPVAGRPRVPSLVANSPNGHRDYKDDVVLTMWESTRLRPEWASQLNRARAVVVPCQWNARTFRESGVTAPIHVVPLGVDPAVYHPRGPEPEGLVVFGCAGRVSHGGVRKGLDDVIRAFLAAFPDEQDVRLEVKVWPDCRLEAPTDDPRIRVIREPLTDEGLADWYRGLSAFVSASRAEGWGLQPHQAMACGRPTIAPIYGGHAEFMTDETTWSVDFDEVEIADEFPIYGGLGSWAVPRPESLAARMREAYGDPEGRRRKGEVAARVAGSLTWSRAGKELVAALRDSGLIGG